MTAIMATLTAILAAIKTASWPAIGTIGSGFLSVVVGGIGSFVGRSAESFFRPYRIYFIVAALAALVAASVGVTVWIMHLQERSAVADRLESQELMLSVDMGCAPGEDVVPCWQRGQLELAESNAQELLKLMQSATDEQERLNRDLMEAQAERSDAEQWRAEHAQDGKSMLPAYVVERYRALRKRGGVQ